MGKIFLTEWYEAFPEISCSQFPRESNFDLLLSFINISYHTKHG
jgi:hypothetical protein